MDRPVTVSVVSHGQRALLNPLLDDLRRLQAPWLRRVIVTLNIAEPDPDIADWPADQLLVLRNGTPLGFGANHNQAFAHCDTPWFAVLNPDLRLAGDPIGPLLASVASDVGVLAPAVVEGCGAVADSARLLLTPGEVLRRRFDAGHRHRRVDVPDWLAGMCLLLRSRAFSEVGGFDQRFFMYCEDADLSLRLQLAGWRLRYSPETLVQHTAQRATYRSARHFRWHVHSLFRHWTSRAYWAYRAFSRQRGRAVRADPAATAVGDCCASTLQRLDDNRATACLPVNPGIDK